MTTKAAAKKKSPAKSKSSGATTSESTDLGSLGTLIDPQRIYTADECIQLLRVGRATLTRYQGSKEFPLLSIGEGRAIGQDILDWMRKQKRKSRKPSHSGTSVPMSQSEST